MTQRRGVRISPLSEGMIWIGQTIKSGTAQNAPYIIERREDGKNIERFVKYDDDAELLKAIRDALNGQL